MFFGTPLLAHLNQLGIRTVIVCGESTSGCVRASAVDAYSNGFHVAIAEECTFDRAELTHKVNLFDLHHKYADVMHVEPQHVSESVHEILAAGGLLDGLLLDVGRLDQLELEQLLVHHRLGFAHPVAVQLADGRAGD